MSSVSGEQVLLSENGVSVSTSRFIVSGQTYAMSGITSVKSYKSDPSRKGPIILGIIGLLLLTGELSTKIVGLLMIGGAVAWFKSLKPTYSVLLSSASGEVRALSSQDESYISRVVEALNDAIITRG
jgi:hypothetical protein